MGQCTLYVGMDTARARLPVLCSPILPLTAESNEISLKIMMLMDGSVKPSRKNAWCDREVEWL